MKIEIWKNVGWLFLLFCVNEMWSYIELNDTLQITAEQGFPVEILDLEKNRKWEIKFEKIQNKIFEWKNKEKARIYHIPPTRVFLVQNIDGKWLYRGKILIIEQTIKTLDNWEKITSWKYKIIQLYDYEYQKAITLNECPDWCSYFK